MNAKFFPAAYFYLAQSCFITAAYEEAKVALETYLKFERINPNTKEEAQRLLVNACFAVDAVKNPKPYNPVNVGEGINTASNEYFPAITGDGNQFLFTRELHHPEHQEIINEDFFISRKFNGVWQTAIPIREVNSMGNEGAPALSVDGNIMFFASCADDMGDYGSQDRKGYGSCDIFYSQKINGRWTKPRNAGPSINTNHWETQPSFSSDGKTLYFIRGLRGRGGVKDQDIYFSTIGEDGRFTPAQKVPGPVNSAYKEESVFIHPDNQTLYFSSDGHPGLGGLDIFVSKRKPTGEWGEPVNLGYPINSSMDENSLLVEPGGRLAFFSSDRKGGFGGLDVYQFELPEELRPEKVTYVKGKVYNALTKEPLEANFELFDLEQQMLLAKSYSQQNGEFFLTLNSNKNYLVNVNKEGFLFYSDNFTLKGKETDFNKPFLLDIPLQPIDTGKVVELKNIFFDVNKSELKPESVAELKKLLAFLQKNPNITIEISGHTDNSGDKKSNVLLSGNRAKSVYDYLVTNGGIAATRLTYKGFGDAKPKVANDSAENMAKNRRTEFKVTAK
jgi:outer membrane protein OmpA-like peptidoglycan-associated protein